MTEEQAMAAVGRDEPAVLEDLVEFAERVALLHDMAQMLVAQGQGGGLEVRAGEVHRWAHTIGMMFTELARAMTRWESFAAMAQDLGIDMGTDLGDCEVESEAL